MDRTTAYAAAPGLAPSPRPAAPAARSRARRATPPAPAPLVRDLRGRAGRGPRALLFARHDLVVVTGLPGGGKSTLMRRAVPGARVDSQDTRDRWERRMPRRLPYALYRPLVRLSHYAGLRRALAGGGGLVVHDCGTQTWVRRWLAREARRRGAALHLVLLDVGADEALAGQRARGRGVSRYAFARHRAATARLLAAVAAGRPPAGCGSAVLLDRAAARALRRIAFVR
ncbi:AAA family ATPase [Streptomyces sp. AD55]|uniref:AAA family ATPase n=1 Tax=Streptomyces sp. AD55 TaxID=3242895 RepID=UPI0035298A1E